MGEAEREGHTPTPWEIFVQSIAGADDAKRELADQVDLTDPVGTALYLLSADGKCPATTGCGPRSEANAALIVTAVNERSALLKCEEALREILARIEELPASTKDQIGSRLIFIAGENLSLLDEARHGK